MSERSLPGYWCVGFLICLSTLLCGTLAVFCSLFSRSGATAHRFAKIWAKSLVYFAGVRIVISGRANFPENGSCIMIANHQSLMDIPVLFSTIPVAFRVLAKNMLFSIPFMGWTMQKAGYIPIHRDDPAKSLSTVKKAIAALSSGLSLLIFPEGGRSMDGRIGKFKNGAFYLAIKAKAPVIPIAICGSRQILPKGSMKVNPGTVRLCIEKPVVTKHLKPRDRTELTSKVESLVKDAFDKESGIIEDSRRKSPAG